MSNLPLDPMRPEERDQVDFWIQNIEIDHRPGRDGNMIQDVRVTFGKRGTTNSGLSYWKSRLPKENPLVWDKFGAAIEQWEKDQTIPVEGLPIEAWPAITKGQIKVCRDLGLRSVEDIATATSSIREKIGMGATDLIQKAKAFLANQANSATANKVAEQEKQLEQMAKDLAEARELIDSLMAKQGKTPKKPKLQEAA